MATTDNGTTGVGAHYWTVQLTPPVQAPPALTEFVAMSRNAIQLSVDLLGRGAPRLPPAVDDLLTATTYQDLGAGEANASYQAMLAEVTKRKESLLETDSSVVRAAITVSARNDSTLQYVQGLVEHLQSQMAALTGKLTSAQCAAVMQQIGYVMDILNARVASVYEANHGTAGSSGGGGGGTASGGATGSSGTPATGNAGGDSGAATTGAAATPAGASSTGTGSMGDPSSMLQQMQTQQMMQQAMGQRGAGAANGQGAGGDSGSGSGQQAATSNAGQSAQTPQNAASPTASGAQTATVAQAAATNGNRLVTVTLDGQKVQLPSVVADAVNKELNNPNGCDARAAYAGTPGQASSWAQVSDIGALRTGDVVQWDNRSAIVVNDANGLRMIIDGNYVPLTQQTSQSPPQDAYGAYGNFRGFFHPAGADLTAAAAEPVSQDTTNPPAVGDAQTAVAMPTASAAPAST